MKPEPRVKIRAASYAFAYNAMVPVAREHGYALALHGTMTRDLDVIAVPWAEQVSDPETLAKALADELGWGLANGHGSPGWKPHGRLAITIVEHETGLWVDLSVMPAKQGAGTCKECGGPRAGGKCINDPEHGQGAGTVCPECDQFGKDGGIPERHINCRPIHGHGAKPDEGEL